MLSASLFLPAKACESYRYIEETFDNVTVQQNVVYGQAVNYLGINQNLRMDIFSPAGDTLAYRPLVLFFFGGAFVIGDKSHADMQTWCDSLSRLGYVCAAVNYRIGLNVSSATSAERAVYRAVQDARAAVRYFKEYADIYNIDTTRIFLGGNSAGAITSLHTAFLDKEWKRPPSTYANTLLLRPDLGCLDCSGNSYQHDVFIKGVINLWGAIGDTSWMEYGQQTALLTIHGTDDPIVPFDQGVPFTVGYNFPYLYGALPINDRADKINIYHEFYPYVGADHTFYGLPDGIVTFPNQYWEPVFNQGKNFLYQLLKFESGHIIGDTLVCESDTVTYIVAQGNPDWKYCWDIQGGIITSNPDSNIVKVLWTQPGNGSLKVTAKNEIDVTGNPSPAFDVQINPLPVSGIEIIEEYEIVYVISQSNYTIHEYLYFEHLDTFLYFINDTAKFILNESGLFSIKHFTENACGYDTLEKYWVNFNHQIPEDTTTVSTGTELQTLIFQVYPNPLSQNTFYLVKPQKFKNQNLIFRLYSTRGSLIFEKYTYQHQSKIVLEKIPPTGIYVWVITSTENKQKAYGKLNIAN